MDYDIVKKRYWQRMKQLNFDHFCTAQNELHSRAYELALKHMVEAMSIHPRISKTIIADVQKKATQIRDDWDGVYEVVTIDCALEEIIAEILDKKYGIKQEKVI